MARPGRRAEEDPIVVYSSLVGVLNAYLSPIGLIALSVWVGVTRVPTVLSTGIGVAGVLLVAIALFDMPLHTVFVPAGVVRVCALRRHRLAWTTITAIERVPRRLARRDHDRARPRRPGGLVARIGRRRYLLCNRSEGALEFDALTRMVSSWDDAVVLRAARPPQDTAPTGLYRRRRDG